MKLGDIPARAGKALSSGGLRWLLLMALLSGLLYFVAIPPWWHYDEPGQFEYAWLEANRPNLLKEGQSDEAMRREMARSMKQTGWYTLRNYTPNFSGSEPVWIGASQTGGLPGYYFVAGLPLRLLRGTDITLQYTVTRLVSLLAFVLTVFLVWKGAGELAGEGSTLQWVVSGFAALLPAFTDVMTSVNDDVAAILASTLFLWLSVRMVQRGFSFGRLFPWAAALALCYWTKNTAWFALALAPFVLLLSLLPGWKTWLPWAATPAILLVAALLLLEGGGAAGWYQDRTQPLPFRVESSRAPAGTHIFQLDYSGGRGPQQTGQLLSSDVVRSLRGKTLTLGAWIWADKYVQVRPFIIRWTTTENSFVNSQSTRIQIGPVRQFAQSVIVVPANATGGVILPPYLGVKARKTSVYFDGVVLAEGAYPALKPRFSDAAGSRGTWNGQPFVNLVDNGSAEQGALRVRVWIDQLTGPTLARTGRLSAIFSLTADWRKTGWYYGASLQTMFRTFWASLAADKFNLSGGVNNALLALTIIGMLGTLRLLWRKRRALRWDIVFVLAAAWLLAWGFAAARSIGSLLTSSPSFPWARYAFPAILPSALLIGAGWVEWLEWLRARLNLNEWFTRLVPLLALGMLSVHALFNVEKYIHPTLAGREWMLWLVGLVLLGFLLLWQGRRLRQVPKTA